MKMWEGIKNFFNRIKLAIENHKEHKKEREESEINRLKRKEKLLKQRNKVEEAKSKLKEKSKDKKGMFDTTENWGLSIGNKNQDTVGLNKVLGGKNG